VSLGGGTVAGSPREDIVECPSTDTRVARSHERRDPAVVRTAGRTGGRGLALLLAAVLLSQPTATAENGTFPPPPSRRTGESPQTRAALHFQSFSFLVSRLRVAPKALIEKTSVSFRLTARARVTLLVKNDRRIVRRLVKRVYRAGSFRKVWGGVDDQGQRVPPGAYRIVLRASRDGDTIVRTARLQVVSSPKPTVTRDLLFGVYAPPAPMSGMQAVWDLEKGIGHTVDIVHLYQAWGAEWGEFREEYFTAADDERRILLTWEPWLPAGGTYQPPFRLAEILRGRYDGYISSWASGLRAYGKPVYLRPMHEMNGNWYPWSGQVNDNNPEQYREAWRHIHDTFEQMGVDNVVWVWSPYALDVPASNRFEDYFPGSDYVDIMGLDGYNWGDCAPEYGGWQSFDDIFRPAYERMQKLSAKPIWIAEVASAPEGGDKRAWIKDAFTSLRDSYSAIEAVVWFHHNKECDWRLTTPADALQAASEALRSP
jgi:hypothetical protein